jgi:hypothetical protein
MYKKNGNSFEIMESMNDGLLQEALQYYQTAQLWKSSNKQ